MASRGGQPGNTNGTKEKRLVTDALRRAATQSPDKLRKACESVLQKAADGDLASFNAIADRLDGRPAQNHTIGGDKENPLKAITEVIISPLLKDESDSPDT